MNLPPSSFGRLISTSTIDFTQNPDFSPDISEAATSTIYFRFGTDQSHTGGCCSTRLSDHDNWSATVNQAPAPLGTLLPPGHTWEYTFVDPTGDSSWNTTTGDWTTGIALFGNDGPGSLFDPGTFWPVDSSDEDDLWVRTTTDTAGIEIPTVLWGLGVDNGFKLYANGVLAGSGFAEGYTSRWEYTGGLGASLVPGTNVIAVALDDRGGATAFDMEITATPLRAFAIVLSPDDAVNEVGTNHTVTALVTDQNGDPFSGATVTVTIIGGPHFGTNDTDTSDSNGIATFTYTGTIASTGPGDNDVIESETLDPLGFPITGNHVTKLWVTPPASTVIFSVPVFNPVTTQAASSVYSAAL